MEIKNKFSKMVKNDFYALIYMLYKKKYFKI